jgi:hypothetical protein
MTPPDRVPESSPLACRLGVRKVEVQTPTCSRQLKEPSTLAISDSDSTKSSQKSAVGQSDDYEAKLCIEESFKAETIVRIHKRRRFGL